MLAQKASARDCTLSNGIPLRARGWRRGGHKAIESYKLAAKYGCKSSAKRLAQLIFENVVNLAAFQLFEAPVGRRTQREMKHLLKNDDQLRIEMSHSALTQMFLNHEFGSSCGNCGGSENLVEKGKVLPICAGCMSIHYCSK